MKPTQQDIGFLSRELRVINVGLPGFAAALRRRGIPVLDVAWRPPAGGDLSLLRSLDAARSEDGRGWREEIAGPNARAIERLLSARAHLMGLGRAGDVVPGMSARRVLHAGPPVSWENMCGPVRGAVIGGLLYEELASSPEEAAALAGSGEIAFSPCHHHQCVGPMAGVVTASMPVWVVENTTYGNRAYSTLNEGLGKVLRYGAYGSEVIERLVWMRKELAPLLQAGLDRHGPVDLTSMLGQALHMGDEGHNRNRAATSLFVREMASSLVRTGVSSSALSRVLEFLHANDHFFLNLSMAAAKCTLDAAAGIAGCSLVTAMARNGTEFGIRVSGTADQWFTAPAPVVDGLYLPGFSAADAERDLGDSAITETAGWGGFAMAAAPAIVQFVGGTARTAMETTERMRAITLAESVTNQIPALGFRGTPTGIDVLRVAETGILPAINTGIAHKKPGVGMVGAGLVTPPWRPFAEAARALLRTSWTPEHRCIDRSSDVYHDQRGGTG